ncbi:MAG: tyrosine--tRNA ligase [Candidatus Babeliaceae bacterium]|jgi:tyrosyl-tRNA synthetase
MQENSYASLCAGAVQVLPKNELIKKLDSRKKLIIKLGADPTSPDLHLGHTIVLSKMRQFQDLGHTIIFLIGDFTARIGDPTGRSKTRPPLTEEVIKHNIQTYIQQVGKVLDLNKIVIRYNSEWLDTLSSRDWIRLCSHVTLARIIEREDFANRLESQQTISFHELLYPLLQAYDSVELKADVELGGTDQTFNIIMGRHLQEQYGQEPQVIMTLPILPGLDGVQKMSKSLGNTIGLTEAADQAYGKVMSISDDLMWVYYELLLGKTVSEVAFLKQQVQAAAAHPMQLKKALSHAIIAKFWSMQEADAAQQTFEHLFQKRDFEHAQQVTLPIGTKNPVSIVELLKILNPEASSSELRRLIEARAVTIDGIKIVDIKALVQWQTGMNIKIGKHKFYTLS